MKFPPKEVEPLKSKLQKLSKEELHRVNSEILEDNGKGAYFLQAEPGTARSNWGSTPLCNKDSTTPAQKDLLASVGQWLMCIMHVSK